MSSITDSFIYSFMLDELWGTFWCKNIVDVTDDYILIPHYILEFSQI